MKNTPGPRAPLLRSRPSRNITARSYSLSVVGWISCGDQQVKGYHHLRLLKTLFVEQILKIGTIDALTQYLQNVNNIDNLDNFYNLYNIYNLDDIDNLVMVYNLDNAVLIHS